MKLVRKSDEKRIAKDRSRFVEGYLVLIAIATSFFLIPIEYELHHARSLADWVRVEKKSLNALELIPIPDGHSTTAAIDSPTDAAVGLFKDILEINEDL